VAGFASSRVPPLKVKTKLTNLESPLNFARFYLRELLPPSASKVLYLAADTIVAGDAVALFDATLSSRDALCAATLRKQTLGDKGVASLKGSRLQARYKARYGAKLPLSERGFNAGVFLFNLLVWDDLNLTAEVEFWIRANNAEQLYALGSQPPLTLAVHGARHGTGRCEPLPPEWHLDCLGCLGAGRLKTDEQIARAKLFHWNGPNKPWTTKGRKAHVELFSPYRGRGKGCD
jgi:lipopolysaccharide biosynthesis glycosyltransferase